MTAWYVVYTHPHAEAQALENLKRQGYVAYLPRYRKWRRHARRREAVAAPLFPGYLFVRMDLSCARWRSINGTFGVNHLVCHGDVPAVVPQAVVDNLQAQEDERGLLPLASLIVLDRGARLRIVDGAFAERIGVYERMPADGRVILLLDLLGREVKVEVPIDAVEAA